jgi:hypothetical protein
VTPRAHDPSDHVFCSGDRVVMVGRHPWATYAGKVIGDWPGRDMDLLIALDNGMNVGAMTHQVKKAATS